MKDPSQSEWPGGQLSSVYEEVLNWETIEGIYQYRIDDVPLWRLIRNTTIVNECVKRGLEKSHRVAGFTSAGAFALAKGLLRSTLQLTNVPKADLLFWGVGRRQKTAEGFASPLIDPIIDLLPQFDSVLFERPLSGKHFQPAVTKKLIWYDAPKVQARIRARVGNSIPAAQRATIEALAAEVTKRFSVPKEKVIRRLQIELAAFQYEKQAATRIVAGAKPRAVLFTNRWVNYGVIAACRELDVPSYELQHGAVGKVGFKYHTPYDPVLDPDGFLVFAREWLSSEWGLPQDRVHNVGAPFIWSQRERLKNVPRGSKIMLVSQPNLSKELSAAFDEICTAFQDKRFLLQLHPQDRHQVEKRYPVSLRPNVEVVQEDRPLYESFVDCQAAIGQDSTALLEASFFGLKVGLMNLEAALQNPIRDRIGSDNFFHANSIDEVAEMLISPRANEALGGNGYFDAFNAQKLANLLAGGS
ncbi:hypothetical protein BPTFM16_02135 [Altererythrobacter insulae]|nr:hypothetical protein BPTFM16_02135 [Altererythrobacter insulae]